MPDIDREICFDDNPFILIFYVGLKFYTMPLIG